MPANTDPIFPLLPKIGAGVLTTTVDAHDGSAGLITLATGGTDGSRLDRVTAVASGTTVATVLRLWLTVSAVKYLIYEVAIPASTDSEVAAGQRVVIPLDLTIPSGVVLSAGIGTSIGAGTHAKLHVVCEYGDYS